jgi:hypothetical protein
MFRSVIDYDQASYRITPEKKRICYFFDTRPKVGKHNDISCAEFNYVVGFIYQAAFLSDVWLKFERRYFILQSKYITYKSNGL